MTKEKKRKLEFSVTIKRCYGGGICIVRAWSADPYRYHQLSCPQNTDQDALPSAGNKSVVYKFQLLTAFRLNKRNAEAEFLRSTMTDGWTI